MNVTYFIDASKEGKLPDKRLLEIKHRITIPLMQYLQHIFRTLFTPIALCTSLTEFEKLLKSSSTIYKGLLSKLYNLLAQNNNAQCLSYIKTWLKDLNTLYNDKFWSVLWHSLSNLAKAIPIKLQFFKLIAHWYITPSKLHHISPTVPPVCWKGCGQKVGYFYCW